jgi:hypothetical protein
MTANSFPPPGRVYAELPSGAYLVPGEPGNCPGADASGLCPLGWPASARPCAGAIWCYDGPQGWRVNFTSTSSVCPVAVLDPLGLPETPLD